MTPLRLHQVGKVYGDTAVFSNVSLQVHQGEFVAIMGESGVGKSSLLNCIAGLDQWDSGTIHLCGVDLSHASEATRASLRRDRLGFVFQAFHVLPHLDVAQNVGLPLVMQGLHNPTRVLEILDALGIGTLGRRLPQQLSGGQLQRVAIARALVHRPALILADEPTGNLDPKTASGVLMILREQCHLHGAALILVTHSATAARSADRTLRLSTQGIADATTW